MIFIVIFFFQGTLRVLLVLLHDFPEFLCDYHYVICDVIAPNCILMRNLILSAFPRNMRLPDPFTPNLKVDLLPEITQAPRILANFNNLIQPASFKKVSFILLFLRDWFMWTKVKICNKFLAYVLVLKILYICVFSGTLQYYNLFRA